MLYGCMVVLRSYNKQTYMASMNKRIIRLTESDLHRIVKESVDRILTETHIRKLYHFVSPKQLQYIFRYGFKLNDREANYSINPQLPNFLSFSRNRNAVQGFPYMNSKYSCGGGTTHNSAYEWLIIRIEIDAEKLNNLGKVKPFDYINHFKNEEEQDLYQGFYVPTSSKEEVAQMARDYQNNAYDEEIYAQPFSQSEERLYSKLKRIPRDVALSMIKRIDVFADFDLMHEEEYKEFNTFSKWLCNRCSQSIKLVFYNDINEFNLQVDHPKKQHQ